MKAPPTGQSGSRPAPAALPKIPELSEILGMIRLDKYEVQLSSYEPASDEITVTNKTPGQISLSVDPPPMPGFEVKLERKELNSGESAKVYFKCKPADKTAKRSLDVPLRVDPFAQVYPIHVTFAIPPEIQKQLPRIPK